MFPLVPENLKKDYFYNQGTCTYENAPTITVKKWLNGNNGLYMKYKKIYIEWINLIEDIQINQNNLSNTEKNTIKFLLFENYNLNNVKIKKQITTNMKNIRKILQKKGKN